MKYKVVSVAGNDARKFEEELNRFVGEGWAVSSDLNVTYDPVTEKFLYSILISK
jgi:hypothetical protein